MAGQDAERSAGPRTDGGPDGPAEYRQNKIIVRSQTDQQTKTQLAAINRDPDSVIEVTSFKDEGFELYVSDTAVRAAGEGLRTLRENLKEALASTVGDIEAGLGHALSEDELNQLEICLSGPKCSELSLSLITEHGLSLDGIVNKVIQEGGELSAELLRRLEDAYKRDPETLDALLTLAGGIPGIVIEEIIENDPELKASFNLASEEGGKQLSRLLDSINQKVSNGELDKEEAAIISVAAVIGALKLAPKKLRGKLIASIKNPLSKLTKRFRGAPNRTGHAASGQTLVNHNTVPTRKGTTVKGGHNEQSFNNLAASDPNINVGSTTQVAPGIKSIEYTVTKADGSVSAPRTKTVYDPNVYSDQQIADMSSTAISQAPTPAAGSNLSTTVVDGLKFTVTRDQTRSVNNVFISGAN